MFTITKNSISMKKINLSTVLLVFFIFLASNYVYSSSDSIKVADLDFKIKKLEEYRTIDDKKFENKSKELDLKLEEYKQQKTVLDWIAIGAGGFSIISLLGFWLKAKSYANKKIEEKFHTIFEEKKDLLVNMIDAYDKEKLLKEEKSVYIIASKVADTKFLSDFFKKLGFVNVKIDLVTDYNPIDNNNKYDLLFVFREENNNPLSDEITKKYIVNSRQDSIVFIFGKHIDLANFKTRSSSATFWSQLYGNLISALKYQKIIG